VQSTPLLGHDGPPRKIDDYVAMTTMSLVLGGMFSSRLNLKTGERMNFAKPSWQDRYKWWEDSIATLRGDPLKPETKEMAKTLAELKVGAVLMHSRGRPEEWKSLPPIGDPVLTVKRDLRQWAEAATLAGIKRDRLVLDPGFGFGKRFEENYPLLAHFAELQQTGFPLLAGVSRKSFIGRMLAHDGKDAPVSDRLYGTLAAETALILKGVHIIRTHDVQRTLEAAKVADAVVVNGG